MKRRHGFTLVELLVVVGIIAALIAVLLPVLQRVRKAAQRVTCASNMRQLGHAFIAYTADNDGKFPESAIRLGHAPGDWIYWQPSLQLKQSRIANYLSTDETALVSVLRCPMDDWEMRQRGEGGEDPYQYSYSLNYFLGAPFHPGMSIWRINNPANKIMVAEEGPRNGFPYGRPNDGNWVPGNEHDYLTIRHGTRERVSDSESDRETLPGANACFSDGHVEIVTTQFAIQPEHSDPAN